MKLLNVKSLKPADLCRTQVRTCARASHGQTGRRRAGTCALLLLQLHGRLVHTEGCSELLAAAAYGQWPFFWSSVSAVGA